MFPSISVKDDLDKLVGWGRLLSNDQLPFATSVAINQVATDAAAELAAEMPRYLDRPTAFTLRAWGVQRSSKRALTATVFAKDAQAKYLRWQVAGGDRQPSKRAQRLPSDIKLDDFGNLPRGEIARLIRLAQEGKRLTRRRGERLGVSSKLDLFYGDPGNGMPPGIYKRVVQGVRHILVPIIVFPARAAHYEPRFPMARIVQRVVRERFAGRFQTAWASALRTAR